MPFDFSSIPQLKNTKVIGLGHRARHGKGTVANVLLDVLGSRARYFAFADALKFHCRTAYGMTSKDARLLQRVGTDLVRMGRDPYWPNTDVDSWLAPLLWTIQEWDADAKGSQIAIIGDVRFPNEAQLIKALGGKVVRVQRFNEDGTPFVSPDRDPNHPSEIALADYEWDHTINAASTEELQGRAASLFSKIVLDVMTERFGPEMLDVFEGAVSGIDAADSVATEDDVDQAHADVLAKVAA